MSIPKLRKIEKTCAFFPSQWDAWAVDGTYVYIRYRHGWLTVSTAASEKVMWDLEGGTYLKERPIIEIEVKGLADLEMTTAQMLALTGMELA